MSDIGAPKAVVSAIGRVGVPADPLMALRWKASSAPGVQAIDAKLADLFQRQEAALAAFYAERLQLDAQREGALKAAMRELVG